MPVVPGTKVKVVFIPLNQVMGRHQFGDPLNTATLSAAPPCDANYKSQASFLAAIETMAENTIKSISGYNALAVQQNLPAIEALLNPLFSSNIYKQDLNVPADQIARAIFKGFATALSKDPNSGLVELQLPVGDAKLDQDRLFAVVEQDLAVSPSVVPHPFLAIRGGANVPPEVLDPNNDDDPVQEEPQKVQEADTNGADPRRIIVANRYDLTSATTALVNATKALDPILKGSGALPTGPYGRVDLNDEPHYADPTSALEPGREYQMLPIKASWLAGGPQDTPAQNAGRDTAQAANNLLTARDNFVNARTLDEARAARDNAYSEAGEAENAAANAEAEAAKATATVRDKMAAEAAREVARTSRNLATEIDSILRATERALPVYRDAAGKLALSRILSPVVASVVLAAGIGGLLGWLFGSKGGLEVPGGPANKPLDLGALDDGTPVDVDVMTENVALDPAFKPSLVKAVHLSDMGQITDTIGTPGTTDVWTAANKHITFTPKSKPQSGDKVSVLYALEYDGTATSPATLLQITFVNKAIRLVQKAVTDSKGAVSATFAIPLPDQFVLRPSAFGWTLDKANKTLTYVPPAGTTVAVVSEDYSLGLGLATNTAKIVVLLPPSDLPVVKASPASPMIPLQQLPDPGPAAWTLVQSATPVAGGAWSLANNTIMFVPDTTNPPAVGSTLTVDFALTRDNVVSETGKASIQFTGSVMPMTMNIDIVAPNRTNPSFTVSVPAAVTGLQLGSASTAEGTWNVTGNQVVFTPKSANSFVDQASNTYAGAGVTGTITIIFPINIAITDADRKAVTPVNVQAYNSKITRSFTLSVQDTVPPQDTSGATWKDGASSVPKAPGLLQFTPPSDTASMGVTGAVLQIAAVSKVYVITFADGSSTSATVTLTFTTGLKAYDFTYDALSTDTYLTIDFLPHCYVPNSPGLRSGQIAGGVSPAYAEPDRQNPNVVVGNWTLTGMGTRSQIILSIVDRSYREFHVTYAVVDLSNTVSNFATITVRKPMMAMPRAADFMLAKDIWSASNTGNEQLAVDVLQGSSSFYAKDPASVTLTGLYDLGQDFSAASAAILQTDGKGLRIPDEGVWVVDDKTGNIGFQAVPGLTHAPTPVGFRFCDAKGNQSNEGIVVVDPLLTHAVELPKSLAKMDDTAFWSYFRKHISQWQPPLGADVFIATITVLAGATKSIGRVGRNPVSGDDFDKGFNAWLQGGKHWDDPAGTANPVGLFSICHDLVKNANQGTDMIYRERYWALTIMARMAAKH